MLNIFPDALTYHQLAPLLLRVILGLLFVNLGYLELAKEAKRWERTFEVLRMAPARFWSKALGIVEVLGGLLLIVGLYTQGAALVLALISLAEAYVEQRTPEVIKRGLVFYILLSVISVSLILTGAGFLAFDIPL
jgi:uncharacterized membrane protein YphA (DoxX/SURF4 family)